MKERKKKQNKGGSAFFVIPYSFLIKNKLLRRKSELLKSKIPFAKSQPNITRKITNF